MALTIRHVGIVVTDLNSALKIFNNYLGCETTILYPELRGEFYDQLVGIQGAILKIAIVEMVDNSRIELIEYVSSQKIIKKVVRSNNIGVSHFAISVENIDMLYTNSTEYDVKFVSKPLLSLDKKVKVAYVILMNEILVEFVEVLS